MSVFKRIPGFSSYEISSCGKIIRKIACGTIVWQFPGYKGYQFNKLTRDDGRSVSKRVHRAVAFAFHGPAPSPERNQVRHLDGDERNKSAGNLAWGTNRENADDVIRQGTQAAKRYALTQAERDAIRGSTVLTKVLAKPYGVSIRTIDRYKAGSSRRKKL